LAPVIALSLSRRHAPRSVCRPADKVQLSSLDATLPKNLDVNPAFATLAKHTE
jgi:hypothetical protein